MGCTPAASKAPEMTASNPGGHGTILASSVGLPAVQPHDVKSSQPRFTTLCASVADGSVAHEQPFVVSEPNSYQGWIPVSGSPPQMDDSARLIDVPLLPQMLAVEYCRLSYPGTAMSMCLLPGPHPAECGGQRFFFIITTDHSGFIACNTGVHVCAHM